MGQIATLHYLHNYIYKNREYKYRVGQNCVLILRSNKELVRLSHLKEWKPIFISFNFVEYKIHENRFELYVAVYRQENSVQLTAFHKWEHNTDNPV